jgi:hypothetical protein
VLSASSLLTFRRNNCLLFQGWRLRQANRGLFLASLTLRPDYGSNTFPEMSVSFSQNIWRQTLKTVFVKVTAVST